MEPLIDIKMMKDVLNELNINVSIKDLNKPNIEALIMIYRGFLDTSLVAKPIVYELDPPDAALYFTDDAIKSQSESFKFLRFYMLIGYLYDLVGMSPTFLEIFHPTKKLLQKQLSILISFAQFQLRSLNEFSVVQENNKQYMAKAEEIKKESDDLSNKIYCLKQSKNEKRHYIENTKKRNALLREKLNAVIDQRKKLTIENQAATKEEDATLTEINELQIRQNNVQKKNSLYEKLLVRSPERINNEIVKNTARIQELEKLIQLKRKEYENTIEHLYEIEKLAVKFQELIREPIENFLLNDVEKLNAKRKEIQNSLEDISNSNLILRQVDNTISSQKSAIEQLKANLSVMHNEFNSCKLSIENKKNEYDEKCKIFIKESEEIEKEIIKYQNERNKIYAKFNETINTVLENIGKLKQSDRFIEITKRRREEFMEEVAKEVRAKNEQIIRNKFSKILDFLKDI